MPEQDAVPQQSEEAEGGDDPAEYSREGEDDTVGGCEMDELTLRRCVAQHQLHKLEGKQIVLVVGTMGAGKSTFIAAQVGATLRYKTEGARTVLEPSACVAIPSVGHRAISQTLNVTLYTDEESGLTFADTPGSNENRGQTALTWTRTTTLLALTRIERVHSIVVIINFEAATTNRAEMFELLATDLASFVGESSHSHRMYESMVFVINRARLVIEGEEGPLIRTMTIDEVGSRFNDLHEDFKQKLEAQLDQLARTYPATQLQRARRAAAAATAATAAATSRMAGFSGGWSSEPPVDKTKYASINWRSAGKSAHMFHKNFAAYRLLHVLKHAIELTPARCIVSELPRGGADLRQRVRQTIESAQASAMDRDTLKAIAAERASGKFPVFKVSRSVARRGPLGVRERGRCARLLSVDACPPRAREATGHRGPRCAGAQRCPPPARGVRGCIPHLQREGGKDPPHRGGALERGPGRADVLSDGADRAAEEGRAQQGGGEAAPHDEHKYDARERDRGQGDQEVVEVLPVSHSCA
jgi:hypothetical protein